MKFEEILGKSRMDYTHLEIRHSMGCSMNVPARRCWGGRIGPGRRQSIREVPGIICVTAVCPCVRMALWNLRVSVQCLLLVWCCSDPEFMLQQSLDEKI
jgi:hypothetical protein